MPQGQSALVLSPGRAGLAFGLVIAAAASTCLGACIAFFVNVTNKRVLAAGLALSTGVMIFISLVEIVAVKSVQGFMDAGNNHQHAMAYAYLAFFAGVSLTWVLDQCVYFLMYLSDKRRAAQHTASCELASLQGAVISPPTCCNDAQANTACSTCTELCSCGCRQPECCSSPSTPADARVHTCTCQAQVTQPAAALSTLSGDANPSGCTSCTGMLHVGCSATNILSTFQKQQASLPPSCPCLNHSSLQRSRAAKHMHVVTQAAHSRQCLPAQQRDIILQVQADQNVVTEAPTHAATEACNGDAVRPMLPVHGCMDSCMAGCSITRKVDASCMDLDQEAALLLKRMGLLAALAVSIHNMPEGLATFISTVADSRMGVAMAIAIAMHNIPEGIVVCMPLYYATHSRLKGMMWAALSGAAEVFGAVIGYVVVKSSGAHPPLLYGLVFGIVGGMMAYISLFELLPTALRYDPGKKLVMGFTLLGMAVMAASLVLFEV